MANTNLVNLLGSWYFEDLKEQLRLFNERRNDTVGVVEKMEAVTELEAQTVTISEISNDEQVGQPKTTPVTPEGSNEFCEFKANVVVEEVNESPKPGEPELETSTEDSSGGLNESLKLSEDTEKSDNQDEDSFDELNGFPEIKGAKEFDEQHADLLDHQLLNKSPQLDNFVKQSAVHDEDSSGKLHRSHNLGEDAEEFSDQYADFLYDELNESSPPYADFLYDELNESSPPDELEIEFDNHDKDFLNEMNVSPILSEDVETHADLSNHELNDSPLLIDSSKELTDQYENPISDESNEFLQSKAAEELNEHYENQSSDGSSEFSQSSEAAEELDEPFAHHSSDESSESAEESTGEYKTLSKSKKNLKKKLIKKPKKNRKSVHFSFSKIVIKLAPQAKTKRKRSSHFDVSLFF